MNILIVDDEKAAALALKEFLQDQGPIALAHDGEEALHYLQKNMVDLVITDHSRPKKMEPTLLRKLLSSKESPTKLIC